MSVGHVKSRQFSTFSLSVTPDPLRPELSQLAVSLGQVLQIESQFSCKLASQIQLKESPDAEQLNRPLWSFNDELQMPSTWDNSGRQACLVEEVDVHLDTTSSKVWDDDAHISHKLHRHRGLCHQFCLHSLQVRK